MLVLRSMLFVPGNNLRMIVKAATLPSDAIILDLEDAVALPDKATARVIVRDSIKAIKQGGGYVFVRVNAMPTKLTGDDLQLVTTAGLDGIMLAKTETRADIAELDRMVGENEKRMGLEPGSVKLIPLVESARGVINAYEIASASERTIAVAFGAGDYYRDLGRNISSLSSQQNELLYARSQVVNGSVAARVQPIDTVFFGLLTDTESFTRETVLASQLGFKGKMLIHPNQIEIVNTIFAPSADEVEYAKRLVVAFQEAQSRGAGAISFEGKMIDYMNYQQAKDLTSFAEVINSKKETRQNVPYISLSQYFTADKRS